MSISHSDLVAATYFDGRSSGSVAASLRKEGDNLLVVLPNQTLRWSLANTDISERLGSTPRLLRFPDGSHCEVTDHTGLNHLLGQPQGITWLDRAQHTLWLALFSVILLLGVIGLGYRFLLPIAAEHVAGLLPKAAMQELSRLTLEALDDRLLEPSQLPPARQQSILTSFASLPLPKDELEYHIEFRYSSGLGANAFALPDGHIVVLDDLVSLTNDDREIAAVLAHEFGHVDRRHTMRLLLQDSVVGIVLTWYLGDISSMLSTAPTLLLQAGYSREMEREADTYAVRLLQEKGWSPCLLSALLSKLEAANQQRQLASHSSHPDLPEVVNGLLASHPNSPERIREICPGN